MIQFLSWLPVNPPRPPANPPIIEVTKINNSEFGKEKMVATRSVSIEPVLKSVIIAVMNHSKPTPRNPLKKEDGPLE